MMRNKTSSSMQKTYDECYLICSTAVYFEGQNNEAEALRSWRSALDRIYYHNAYRVPPDHRPKSETERALQDSLRNMELQCKERVGLLEALRDSRAESKNGESGKEGLAESQPPLNGPTAAPEPTTPGWIGGGTIPAINYPDLCRPRPSLPQRPSMTSEQSSQRLGSIASGGLDFTKPLTPNPPPTVRQSSRHSSPDKKGRMKTTLRTSKDGKKPSKPKAIPKRPQAADAAAGLAWNSGSRLPSQALPGDNGASKSGANTDRSDHESTNDREDLRRGSNESIWKPATRSYSPPSAAAAATTASAAAPASASSRRRIGEDALPPAYERSVAPNLALPAYSNPSKVDSLYRRGMSDVLPYRNEYPAPPPVSQASMAAAIRRPKDYEAPIAAPDSPGPLSPQRRLPPPVPTHRRPVGNVSSSRAPRPPKASKGLSTSSESADETTSSRDPEQERASRRSARKKRVEPVGVKTDVTPESSDQDSQQGSLESEKWEERVAYLKKNLPKGVDPFAAKQIFNEIVVHGDEVHWADVAGLDNAKKALKEAVVYPFLRPDLFMGLREPARGMLLFGPPGTGKTMLARAVATESRSTFFAISASSLTSKWLGDSEKLVRALFALARALAPSIIFVDEIDSLLSSRGGSSEHESTRRIKTEFLIQWSDLQRAAAGKEQSEKEKREGDASRVLVLAATNLPWAIDEAARRRFVRRQYIPLPEQEVRAQQLRTLLGHQKHDLNPDDLEVLVQLTDGYSGSDITALAKDAAMGPLRSLGEALLSMSMDEIRPIQFKDFEASLINIRPSVSKQGLQEFEDWARDFGERGG